jgi:hypothetical protein
MQGRRYAMTAQTSDQHVLPSRRIAVEDETYQVGDALGRIDLSA